MEGKKKNNQTHATTKVISFATWLQIMDKWMRSTEAIFAYKTNIDIFDVTAVCI